MGRALGNSKGHQTLTAQAGGVTERVAKVAKEVRVATYVAAIIWQESALRARPRGAKETRLATYVVVITSRGIALRKRPRAERVTKNVTSVVETTSLEIVQTR